MSPTSVSVVGELGNLLELLHRGGTGDRTVRATIRTWSDPEVASEAFRAAAEEEGGTVFTAYAVASDGEEEEDVRDRGPELVRLWLAPPDRVREEAEGGPEPRVGVRVGRRWWMYDEYNGALSNEDDEQVHSGVGEQHRVLFAPGRLLGALVLEPAGAGEVAGRPARLAVARPRPGGDDDREPPWMLHEIGAGAEEWSLAVDEEHGVLLSVEARRGGRAFQRIEVLELAVGEAIPDEVFTFEPPPGEEVRGVRDDFRLHHHVRLEELGRLVPFAVFVPDRLAAGWRLESMFSEGSGRPSIPPTVHVRVVSDDGHWQVALDEVAADAEPPDYDALDVPEAWETVVREGREIAVREPSESWAGRLARVEIEGTRITLSSGEVGTEHLVELAARLVRAPEAPPPL